MSGFASMPSDASLSLSLPLRPGLSVARQVTGILFEMKVDYTTWFGANPEYIHGIQVRPAPSPPSDPILPRGGSARGLKSDLAR